MGMSAWLPPGCWKGLLRWARKREESTPGISATKGKAVATEASENYKGLVQFPSNSRNELGIKNVVQK